MLEFSHVAVSAVEVRRRLWLSNPCLLRIFRLAELNETAQVLALSKRFLKATAIAYRENFLESRRYAIIAVFLKNASTSPVPVLGYVNQL